MNKDRGDTVRQKARAQGAAPGAGSAADRKGSCRPTAGLLPALLMSVALHALTIGVSPLERMSQGDQIPGIARTVSGGRSPSIPDSRTLIVEMAPSSGPPADPLIQSSAARPPAPYPLSAPPIHIGPPRANGGSKPTESPSRPAKGLSRKDSGHRSKTDHPARDRRASVDTTAPKGGSEIARPQTQGSTQSTGQTMAMIPRPQGPQAAEGEYLRALVTEIARAQRYPEAARRQAKAGIAVVSFVIRSDGSLSAIRLTKGSGHPELDQAALDALHRLGRFRPIPPNLGRSTWPIQVPIRFQLE